MKWSRGPTALLDPVTRGRRQVKLYTLASALLAWDLPTKRRPTEVVAYKNWQPVAVGGHFTHSKIFAI